MDATSHPDEELGFKRARGNWKVFDLPLERPFEAADRWGKLVGLPVGALCIVPTDRERVINVKRLALAR